MKLWRTAQDLLRRHGKCAMITIVEVKGSSPRDSGARLIVTEDGFYRGTIGGGALEWQAMARAQSALASGDGRSHLTWAALGPDLGQCCGGQVKLFTEIFSTADLGWIGEFALKETQASFSTLLRLDGTGERRVIVELQGRPGSAWLALGNLLRETFGEERRHVLLFGAGHVGRALVLALAPLPFAVTWIDSRQEAFPHAVPADVVLKPLPDPVAALDLGPAQSFVVVMTHSHALDFDIVLAALKDDRFPYVGLIGSETKRARFLSRLRKVGIGEKALPRLVCPLGIAGISSKEPAVIAAAATAELLLRDEELRAEAKPLDHRQIA
jgi:xanthine dehydrogenase accessory factor